MLAVTSASAGETTGDEVGFPLVKGSVWTYRGTVRWVEPGSTLPRDRTLTWTMGVLDVVQRDFVTAAIIKGFPDDLAWYQEGKPPGEGIIVQVSNKSYVLKETRAEQARKRLLDGQDALIGLVDDDELVLDLPLHPGKRFGPVEQLTRPDTFYSWFVESAQAWVGGVRGVPEQPRTAYRLALRSLPDHTFIDVVPGIGIVRYVYGHHGTLSEADVRLVEYRAGSGEVPGTR
jgi:hypothetical protein